MAHCDACRLPYLADDAASSTCAECREAPGPAPDAAVIAATEAEVRKSLGRRLRFVGEPGLDGYLDRVVRDIARQTAGLPSDARVVLFVDDALLTLALPSGTILCSTGTLGCLADESELAFVLAHELAHVGSGVAGNALARAGLRALSRAERSGHAASWGEAALDLVRLGHGRDAELDADTSAVAAIAAAGYVTESALSYLRRIEARTAAGEAELAELSLAHPPVRERLRHLEPSLRRRRAFPSAGCVNREVFRRAAGRAVLTQKLRAVEPFAERSALPVPPIVMSRRVATILILALFGLLAIALVGLALR